MSALRQCGRAGAAGWTLIEVLAVVFVLIFLIGMFLPAIGPGCKVKAERIKCVSNLKNVGLAFRIFATDHGDQFPMMLSITSGGSREFVNDPTMTWLHYAALSNELTTPKLLLCPEDKAGRKEATTFARVFRDGANRPFSENANLSYFVGLDAAQTKPQAFLAGDRNLTSAAPPLAYGSARIASLGTNHTAASGAGWDANIHKHSGNVLLGDGSVQQFTPQRLRDALRQSGDPDNRIAVPD